MELSITVLDEYYYMITISSDKKQLDAAEAAALYIELGWGTTKEYTVARMKKSLANCDIVVFARNDAGELVGIARALSDFAVETKILDMIVAPEYQRQGIGQALMKKIEQRAKGTNIYFAEKCGYKKRGGLTVFVKKK